MRAADTNVLVRLATRDTPSQFAVAQTFASEGVWVPLLAIAEAVWVLGDIYRRNANELVAFLENLLNNEVFVLQDADVVATALQRFRSKPSLGFSDCLMLEAARKAGHLPLGTFDRALGRLPGTQLL